jgi:hypothetical protein
MKGSYRQAAALVPASALERGPERDQRSGRIPAVRSLPCEDQSHLPNENVGDWTHGGVVATRPFRVVSAAASDMLVGQRSGQEI